MSEDKEKYPGLWGITNHVVYVIDVIANDLKISTQEASRLVRDAVESTPVFNRIKRSVTLKRKKDIECSPSS